MHESDVIHVCAVKRRAAAVQSSADAVKFGAKRASMMAGVRVAVKA